MNAPPSTFVRVPHERLCAFVAGAFQAVGMPETKAQFLAGLLATNDLRGIHSHGTKVVRVYVKAMKSGDLNPDPNVNALAQGPTSLQLDGDGGLGYFAAYQGTLGIIEKAKESGVAVLSTRNHGHIGAAGIYARLAVEARMLSFVTSGYHFNITPGAPFMHAGGNPPMCFGTPAGVEDPLVVDFGTTSDLHRQELGLAKSAPAVVFRSIGMAAVAHIWGGVVGGIPYGTEPLKQLYRGANQGSLVFVMKCDLFTPAERLRNDMDAYARAVRSQQPLEGFDESHYPGSIEADHERSYREVGVPVSSDHQQSFEEVAADLGIELPW